MGKALSGELSCPCDRSCYLIHLFTRRLRFCLKNNKHLPIQSNGHARLIVLWVGSLDTFWIQSDRNRYRILAVFQYVFILAYFISNAF